MITLKTGMGGEGLQPYDEKTGEYTKVEVSIGDAKVSDFDSFVEAVVDAKGVRERYDALSPDGKAKFAERLAPKYEEALRAEVGRMNEERSRNYEFFATADDMREKIPGLFTKELIDEAISLGFPGETYFRASPFSSYEVNILSHVLQKARYGRRKFNPISQEEYAERAKNAINVGDGGNWEGSTADAVSSGRDVLLWRGYCRINGKDREACHRGQVDEDDSTSKSLIGSGCYGSVIYMSGNESYSRGSYMHWGLLSHAILRGSQTIRTLDFTMGDDGETDDYESYGYKAIKELQKVAADVADAIAENMRQYEYDNNTIDKIKDNVLNLMGVEDWYGERHVDPGYANKGFCAMLMGYDVVLGDSKQIDILNPALVDMSNEYEEDKI